MPPCPHENEVIEKVALQPCFQSTIFVFCRIEFGLHVKILALYFYGLATNHFEVSIWVLTQILKQAGAELCEAQLR